MAFRFLHAADLHLDTPFEGLSRVEPELARRLVDASLEALDRLVEAALREQVRFVVIAGDVYDGADRGIRAQLKLLDATKRLSGAGIDTFLAHGNHDPVEEGWSAVQSWPERVQTFPSDAMRTFVLDAPGGERVTVTGISYARRDVSENLALRFPPPEGEGFHVAVLHANVGQASEHAAYSPCTVDDLAGTGHHYWALGHVHKRQILREHGPCIAYPGNLQGRSFKPSEHGPKGALLVEVAGARVTSAFLDLAPVRFDELVVDARECEDLGAVADALMASAGALETGGRRVLVRATVTGATPAWDSLTDDGAADELLQALRDRSVGLPDLCFADLKLDVHPAVDIDSYAGRGDLLGELVDEAARVGADALTLRTLLTDHEGLRGLAADDNTDLSQVLRRATELAVGLLTKGST